MQRLLEFIQHHPFLNGLVLLLLLALAVDEFLRRNRRYRVIGPAEGVLLINKGAAVLDLRAQAEFSAGHIINARNLPFKELAERGAEIEKLRGQALLLCCKTGADSETAATRLVKQGYAPVSVLKGGIAAWRQEQFPLERR